MTQLMFCSYQLELQYKYVQTSHFGTTVLCKPNVFLIPFLWVGTFILSMSAASI